MKRANQPTISLFTFAFCLVAMAFTGCQISSQPVPTQRDASRDTSDASRVQLDRSYGQLPLSFEANQGQTDNQVKFLSRGRGYSLFLTRDEAVMVLRAREEERGVSGSSRSFGLSGAKSSLAERTKQTGETRQTKQTVLRMKLEGTNTPSSISGVEKLPGIVNYFIGSDPKKWRTNIPTYKKVEYKEVYPGIDLAYYGNQGKLEYDLIVAPGADPSQINLAFEGAKEIRLADSGDVILTTDTGDVRLQKPLVYQVGSNGHKTLVAGNYVLPATSAASGTGTAEHGGASPLAPSAISHRPSALSNQPSAISHKPLAIGFEVASYDATKPLVIDPILIYSTYLGGSQSESQDNDVLAVDAAGNAYITGSTPSANFPTTPGAFQTTLIGNVDAFVTKLDPSGAPVYSTYFGGSGETGVETTSGIVVDGAGNAYVTGPTTAVTNFPTTPGAFQTTFNGDADAFVMKFNPTGALVYSTLLGGNSGENPYLGIIVDAGGNAYVMGDTSSPDFPTTLGAFDTTFGFDGSDNFLTKLNPTGSELVYSTFLDNINSQAFGVDGAGNVYVTGNTNSTFPTTVGAFQPVYGGGPSDVFALKLNPTGSALVYSTYLGGSGTDSTTTTFTLVVDGAGNAYMTGTTDSSNFPTTLGAFQTSFGGGQDAFVAKLDPTGMPVYSTYLGGSQPDTSFSLVVDGTGNVYVAGATQSTNFPTPPGAFQTTHGGGVSDAFVTKFNPTGTLVYSTYLGASGEDVANAVAVDIDGNAYVTGNTSSTNFPTTGGASQPTYGGGNADAFVARLNPTGSALVYSTYLGGSGQEHVCCNIAVDVFDNAYVTGLTRSPDFPTTSGAFQTIHGGREDVFVAKISVNTPTGTNVTASAGNGVAVTFTAVVVAGETGATTSSTGPTPPAGFTLGTPPTYYDVTTTATFTPPVTVCITYNPAQFSDPDSLHLFHFENNAWVDVTTSHDTTNDVLCGEVTSLSLFVMAQPSGGALTSLGPANIWVGLKNSDDVGIRFDLRAEVYRNSTQLVGSGEVASVPGGSSGFNNAKQNTIPLTPVEGATFQSGDTVSIKLYVRNACTGSGKNSGTARLWFNDSAANSRFDATIGGNPRTYFLRDAFVLATSPGPGPKKTIDVAAGAKCSPYKTFGTWTTTIP